DIAHGQFKEAGNELKAGWQIGLQNFTEGIKKDTDAADKKLQDFFGKVWFGQANPETPKEAHEKTRVDLTPEDASNPIKDRIAKLLEAAAAEEKLAGAVGLSTAAIRAQNEENEASKVILELQQVALKKHLEFTEADKDAVRQAVIAAEEFK